MMQDDTLSKHVIFDEGIGQELARISFFERDSGIDSLVDFHVNGKYLFSQKRTVRKESTIRFVLKKAQ